MPKTAQELGMQVIADQHAQIEILERLVKRIEQEYDELAAKYERAVACLKKVDTTNTQCLGCGAIVSHGYRSELAGIIKSAEQGKRDG